jgi:peptide/nickel transport system substrate-binding protein
MEVTMKAKSWVLTGAITVVLALPVAARGEPTTAKVLTIAAVETPQGFDKDFQQQVASTEAQANVGATLVRYGVRTDTKGVRLEDYGKLLPGLAESWTISPDNLVHTFKLRKGLKSHYGNDLTADDVKWTYDRSFILSGLGVTSLGLKPFLDADGVKVVDQNTVQFRLKRPNPVFLLVLAAPASGIWDSKEARKHATDKDPWAKEWIANNGPGFGPYKVESLTRGQEAVFVAHEGYYLGSPPIKRVLYKAVPASSNRFALLETGAVDIALELTPLELEQAKSKRGVKITSSGGSKFIALVMNQTKPPFNNPNVRKAMAYAAPYDDVLKSVYRGWASPWRTVIAANQLGYTEEYWPYKTSLERARALLAEAGYPQGFDLTITSSVEQVAAQEIAILYRTNLQRIGIRAQIENLPAAAHRQKLFQAGFEAIMWSAQASVPDIGYTMNIYFRAASRPNWGKFNDPEIDKAVEKGLSLFGQKRAEYFSKLQKPILEAAPWISLAQPGYHFAARSNIEGFVYHNSNYIGFAELNKKQVAIQ